MSLLQKVVKKVIETKYDTIKFHVAGVTFKNEDRKHRQTILRAIYWKDTPFEKGADITFERYDYEGELAIGVYANGQQVGNVPKDLVKQFDSYWIGNYKVLYSVYSGRNDDNKNVYGMSLEVIFDNK